MRALAVTVGIAGVVACAAPPPKQQIVTVAARDTVHDAKTLHVTLSNSGGTVSQDLDLGSHAFPVTFGVEATGRTGDLGIAVNALDANQLVVGLGTATAAIDDPTTSVMLEGADFVVNTDFADDQELDGDFEANGYQLAASADGTWFASYHGACTDPCHMFGRRFDASGKAVESAAAASSNAFPITTTLSAGSPNTAIVANGAKTAAFWDFNDSVAATQGVACRTFDPQGTALPSQAVIAMDTSTDVVAATALSNSNFAVSWVAFTTTSVIRGAVARPDCSVSAGPFTVNTTTTGSIHRPTVSASGNVIMYAWIVDGNVRFRTATNGGLFGASDAVMFAATATESVEHVRLAPYGAGFAVAVRWAPTSAAGQSRIEIYLADNTGKITLGPSVLTTATNPQFEQPDSFGMSTRPDGAIMVVWHECHDNGDGNGCGVFGRLVRPTLAPVGDRLTIPTTTMGDQTGPSVTGLAKAFAVAWTDKSGAEPDHSGLAARARVISPPYDDASAILGGTCSASVACGAMRTCATGTDSVPRCYETCTPPTCPHGGHCTLGLDGATSGCAF